MGRLLRKKASVKKRKVSSDENPTNNGEAVFPTDSGTEKSKGKTYPSRPGEAARTVAGTKRTVPESGIRGSAAKAAQFLREVRAELRKVTWPSRKQTVGSTLVVLVLVMIISFFLGLVDIGLSGLIRSVLR